MISDKKSSFFSRRTDWPQGQNPLSLMLEAKKRAGEPVLDLTQSNPTLCGFEYSTNPIFQNLSDTRNCYYEPDCHGILQARAAVARYYADKNISISPEQIFLTSSTSEAYTFLFRLLLDPGAAVLVPKPSYPLFDYLADINDAVPEKYPLVYDGAWSFDAGRLSDLAPKRPKALVWVNPNNPTGNFASERQAGSLNNFCARSSCPVIADEVFLDYGWDRSTQPFSFTANREILTFTLSGISKILGLPQMKLSWIVVTGPVAERQEAIRRLEIIADTFLSVNTPVQHVVPLWMEQRSAVSGQILQRVSDNHKELLRAAAGHKIEVLNAQGGWYAILRLRSGEKDDEFCSRLLEVENILVHPGFFFDFEDDEHLVISLLPEKEIFSRAVKSLVASVLGG